MDCLVDTGYNGYLIINTDVGKKLKLDLKNAKTVSTVNADGVKDSSNKKAFVKVGFMSEAEYADFTLPCLVKNMPDEAVIGTLMLNHFATKNQAQFVIDFEHKVIQFVQR